MIKPRKLLCNVNIREWKPMIYRGFPYQHEAQRALFKKTESAVCRFFMKKSFGKFRNVFRNAPVLQPVLKKVQTGGLQSYYQNLWHICFSVEVAKFPRIIFLQNISWPHLLKWSNLLCQLFLFFKRQRQIGAFSGNNVFSFERDSGALTRKLRSGTWRSFNGRAKKKTNCYLCLY